MSSTAPGSPAQETYPNRQKILVVDDDVEIRTLVAEQLTKAGFAVVTTSDGQGMKAALASEPADLILLDLSLPGEDGLSLCRHVRERWRTPVIMLTARAEPVDRVIGLEIGADDYIVKPFDPRELVARIRSVMRRAYHQAEPAEPPPPKRARFRGWTLDFENRRLTDAKERVVMLSGAEFSLLKFFVENANQILTRDQILTLASHANHNDVSSQRIADLQISRLRQKLNDDARASELIMTVRSQGYVLAATVAFE